MDAAQARPLLRRGGNIITASVYPSQGAGRWAGLIGVKFGKPEAQGQGAIWAGLRRGDKTNFGAIRLRASAREAGLSHGEERSQEAY